jgi:hypothetical protein
MRTIGFLVIGMALLPQMAEAQGAAKQAAPIKAVVVDKVINANPVADGTAFRLELQLKNGRRVAYQFGPAEAVEVANGLGKPATAGSQKLQVASLVYGMMIQADPEGRAVILTPRNKDGNMESLAIPVTGADELLETLRAKIAEAKAFAAKQAKQPNQPAQSAQPAQPAQQK